MQTFVPYPDIEKSVRCLDRRRANKQRVEAFQIINVLTGQKTGWKNHPVAKMWVGHCPFLILYMNACIHEWIRRGYINNMKFMEPGPATPPPWWGGLIHATHRSALLFKDPVWYGQFGWEEKPEYNYFWPTKNVTLNSAIG